MDFEFHACIKFPRSNVRAGLKTTEEDLDVPPTMRGTSRSPAFWLAQIGISVAIRWGCLGGHQASIYTQWQVFKSILPFLHLIFFFACSRRQVLSTF